MAAIEQRLLDLKREIETARENKNKAEGAIAQMHKQLKDEHGCKTVKAAETKLDKLDARIKRLNTQIADGLSELEEEYSV